MPEIAQIFTEESCMPSRRLLINFQLSRPYWVHVWAILGSCFGYFYNIFASRCLKLFKFSLKNHACYIEEYSLMFNFWDHILAMFGPYQANVLAIYIVSLLVRTLIILVNGAPQGPQLGTAATAPSQPTAAPTAVIVSAVSAKPKARPWQMAEGADTPKQGILGRVYAR